MTSIPPARRDVLKEILNDPSVVCARDFGTAVIAGVIIPLGLFALPSAVESGRRASASRSSDSGLTTLDNVALCGGATATLLGGIYLFQRFPTIASVAFGVALGTNLTSGIYECGRTLYENAELRLKGSQDSVRNQF